MIVDDFTAILGRLVGWYTSGPFIGQTAPVYAIACAGDVYEATPADNRNGELIEDKRHLALAAAPGGSEQRLVFVMASSQFLYPNVRLLGRFMGEAEAGEGEEAETRPVYAIATCRGCLFASDYFNRDDAADPSETWVEEVGEAAIEDGKLVSGDADARFWYWRDMEAPNIGQSGEQWTGDVTVTLSATEEDAEATILAGRNSVGNIYLAISWRFGATDGKLLIRNFSGGTEFAPNKFAANSGWDDTILFEGHGIANPVTIRVCWNNEWNNVGVTRLDGSVWWSSYTGVGLLEGGHGVGSRDVPGGQVQFDDYKASYGVPVIFGQPTPVSGANHASCPTCQRCHGCPDDQPLCVRIPGQGIVLNRTGSFPTGMASAYSHGWDETSDDCGWKSNTVTIDGVECVVSATLMLQINGYWIVRVAVWDVNSPIGSPNYLYQWFRVLGRDAPRCDQWECLELYNSNEGNVVTINWTPEEQEADAPLAGVSISSNDDCFYTCYADDDDEDDCRRENLPETLTMFVEWTCSDGGSAEMTATKTPGPADSWSYEFNGVGGAGTFGGPPTPNGPGQGMSFIGVGTCHTFVNINLHVVSCNPFFATFSGDSGGEMGETMSGTITE